jgi:hypothetical protein
MNDNKVICEIKWTVADLRIAYERKYGRNASDDDIEFLVNHINWKRVEEVGIENGWEIIDTVI